MNEWDLAVDAFRLHGKSIFAGVILGLFIASIIFTLQKPVWQSEMIVGPSERTGVPSMASLLPRNAADAPALQYFVERIDAAHSTDFTLFETLLNSPQSILNFSKANLENLPVNDTNELQLWLNKNLKIRPVGITPYLRVILRHKEKNQGPLILRMLYKTTDQTIRNDKKIKTQRRIVYLNQQLKIVKSPEHRDAIIALLKEQEQIAMMVSIDNEFAAELIEPPHTLPKHVAPNAVILFPLFAFAGGFIGLMLSGFIRAIKK